MYEFEYFKCKSVRIESKISGLAEVESASFYLSLLSLLIANLLIPPPPRIQPLQLCNSNKSTCVHIILGKYGFPGGGRVTRVGGYNPPALNTCRPNIKGYTKNIIIHTHSPYQSIIPKVMIEKSKRKINVNINTLLMKYTK
jgi:hypothetical protein